MALDGGHGSRAGRPPMPGISPIDERRIFYYVVWPMTFISIHPDYLLLHRLSPEGPDRTRVVCDWLFERRHDRDAGLRPVRRGRVLGPDQPPGLARLRAPAARHDVALVGRRPLLQPGGLASTPSTGWSPTATPAIRSRPRGRSASATTCRRRSPARPGPTARTGRRISGRRRGPGRPREAEPGGRAMLGARCSPWRAPSGPRGATPHPAPVPGECSSGRPRNPSG